MPARRTRQNGSETSGAGPIFVGYFRVSDKKQGESGLGLDAQRTSVERYLAQVGGKLVDEKTEVETGTSHKKRPQLKAAIESAKRLGATLLIAKLDRLARNVHFISGLMEAAADFVIVDMPQANRLTIHIMAAIAEHEARMISARTTAALAEINKQIEQTGSHTVKRNGQTWECRKLGNPRWSESISKAHVARRKPKAAAAAELGTLLGGFRSQGLTVRQMAGRLNSLGIKTPTGGAWHPSSVHKFLRSTGVISTAADSSAA